MDVCKISRNASFKLYHTDNFKTRPNSVDTAELQIRGGIEDNSKVIFLFLIKNICCDPSLEPSQRDGSNDGS